MLALRRMLTPRRKRVAPPAITAPILTAQLLIRPTEPRDAEPVFASITAEIERINGWTDTMKYDLQTAISRDTDPWHWVICRLDTDEIVGVIGAHFVDPLMIDGCEIGFWMLAAHRRVGLMTEAVQAFVDRLALNGVTRVRASTAITNVAVQRLLPNTGFIESGRRSITLPDSTVMDAIDYTLGPR